MDFLMNDFGILYIHFNKKTFLFEYCCPKPFGIKLCIIFSFWKLHSQMIIHVYILYCDYLQFLWRFIFGQGNWIYILTPSALQQEMHAGEGREDGEVPWEDGVERGLREMGVRRLLGWWEACWVALSRGNISRESKTSRKV